MRQKQGDEAEARKRGSKGTRQNKATRAETKSADYQVQTKEGTEKDKKMTQQT